MNNRTITAATMRAYCLSNGWKPCAISPHHMSRAALSGDRDESDDVVLLPNPREAQDRQDRAINLALRTLGRIEGRPSWEVAVTIALRCPNRP